MKACKKYYTKISDYLEDLKQNINCSKEILDIVDKDIDDKYLQDNNMKIFAIRIRKEREKRNLSARNIHEMTGISISSVGRCESNENIHELIKKPETRECYAKIFALIYSISPLYLLGAENELVDADNNLEIALFGKDLKFTDLITGIDPLKIMYNYLSNSIDYSMNFEKYLDMQQNIIDRLNIIFFTRLKCNYTEKAQQVKILKDIIKIKESNIEEIEIIDQEKYKYFVDNYTNNGQPKIVTSIINSLELVRNNDKDFYNLLAYISLLPMYLRYNILNILSFIMSN